MADIPKPIGAFDSTPRMIDFLSVPRRLNLEPRPFTANQIFYFYLFHLNTYHTFISEFFPRIKAENPNKFKIDLSLRELIRDFSQEATDAWATEYLARNPEMIEARNQLKGYQKELPQGAIFQSFEFIEPVNKTKVTIVLLTNLPKGYERISKPFMMPINDEQKRFRVGPKWYQNSCAFDCIVVAAIQMNIGRTITDAMTPHGYSQLPVSSRAICLITQNPWGSVSIVQRQVLVQEFRDKCIQFASHMVERIEPKGFTNINLILNIGLVSSPQMICTQAKMWVKCGRTIGWKAVDIKRGFLIPRYYRENEKKRPESTSSQTYEMAMNKKFFDGIKINFNENKMPALHATYKCDEEGCDHHLRQVTGILDRPPPILAYPSENDPGYHSLRGARDQRKYFANQIIKFRGMGINWEIEYRLKGVFYYTSGHYTTRWLTDEGILHFDGMKKDGYGERVQSWIDSFPKSNTTVVSTVFYNMINIRTL